MCFLPQVHVFVNDKFAHGQVHDATSFFNDDPMDPAFCARVGAAVKATLQGMSLQQAGIQLPPSTMPHAGAATAVPVNVPGAVALKP